MGLTVDFSRESKDEYVILQTIGPVRAEAGMARVALLRVIARVEVVQVVAPLARGCSRVIQRTPGHNDFHRLLLLQVTSFVTFDL